jgi:citronellol/citronellal dehydrogenase
MSLAEKTVFITGASRGIGLAIACRTARDGANVVIAAKTAEPHPRLQGTIYTAAAAIESAGGRALPLIVDVRDEDSVARAIESTLEEFGGIDIVVNNASAISLTNTSSTDMKRYDLMQQINARGTYLCTRLALPHLRRARNPHVLNISPPLDLDPKWFAPHVAYTIAKFGMSFCTLGHAHEFRSDGIAVNSLWPITPIDTAAVHTHLQALTRASRKAEIVADAAHIIFCKDASKTTGNFFLDEEVLRAEGITDFLRYAVDPTVPPAVDYFVSDEAVNRLPTQFTRLAG